MSKTINNYAQNVMLRSVNRLINKYGHNVVLNQIRDGEPTANTGSKAIFGSYKVNFASGTLVINNNFKVRIRADDFPYPILPTDTLLINGVTLTVINARKISPDGASTIVWEAEASGSSIPADGNSAYTPSVTSPTNNTSFYATVASSMGLYAGSFVASAYIVESGDTEYVSSDWQISTVNDFTSVVNEAYGVGTTWVSGTVLSNPMNYYVRVRHNGTNGVVTPWSSASLFSFGAITTTPAIDTPTLVTPAGSLEEYSTYVKWYTEGDYTYQAAVFLSEFSSSSGKVFDHVHWVITNDSGLVWEGDSAGTGYDIEFGTSLAYNQTVMPFRNNAQPWYIKGKYVATDATESAYSPLVTYTMA